MKIDPKATDTIDIIIDSNERLTFITLPTDVPKAIIRDTTVIKAVNKTKIFLAPLT